MNRRHLKYTTSMDQLVDEVEAIRENVVNKKSKEVYAYGTVKFIVWLHVNKPEVITPHLRDRLSGVRGVEESAMLKEKSLCVKRFLQEEVNQPPLLLLQITPKDFECFLMSLRKRDGKKPGKSVYSSMRSSLFHLYRTYNVKMPTEFDDELKRFFKGLKRAVVRRQHDAGESLVEGKFRFSFSFFQTLCKAMREETKPKFVFGHTFLVISWNLMCRAGNSISIRYEHIEWDEDALAIWFGHMKNDQEGERQRDPRHVYANPMEPDICPILSLAIYFSVIGFNKMSLLFSGSNQYDRYSKILKKAMQLPLVAQELRISGREASDYGSHSARKGASTYVSGCCTGGPSSASVCLRAGWNLPGVQDTYVRYEGAGDRVVGRFVAGLPYETPDFAILPPFFEVINDEVWDAVKLSFPNAPAAMQKMCCYLLASLVYHHEHLEASLDPNHALFSSPLFRDRTVLHSLTPSVVCRRWRPGDAIRASGVPPHLGVIVNMENRLDNVDTSIFQLHEKISSLDEKVEALAPHVINEVTGAICIREMDTLSTSQNTITNVVTGAVAAALDSAGLTQMVRTIHANSAAITQVIQQHAPVPALRGNINEASELINQPNNPYEPQESEQQLPIFRHTHWSLNGFTFPKVSLRVAWEFWWFGCPSKNWPPYRSLSPIDLPSKNARKRLSDFRFVMIKIENIARQTNTYTPNPSIHQARQMLSTAMDLLPLGDRTQRNYSRRKDQLQWSTVVNLLRRRTNMA